MIRIGLTIAAGILCIGLATVFSLHPIDASLHEIASEAQTVQITDRNGVPLSASYQNRWNSFDTVPLYKVPDLLKTAFLTAEDRHYFEHRGVDWGARFAALMENLRAGHRVRGASTISEQVVHMIDPRPRNLWSKWLEGFEALRLEQKTSKADILEFYLNQVPYAANRRGVLQGAHYYFNRDLSTLNQKEMLALAILARSPTFYDPYKHPDAMDTALRRLLQQLALTPQQREILSNEKLTFQPTPADIDARQFVRYVRLTAPSGNTAIETTLDASLQRQVQAIVNQRVRALASRNVHNAAALVVDHETGEILAWVVAGEDPGSAQIDAVQSPRQPGSALKPFLYTAALDKGWTAATIIDDPPLAEAVGNGLHRFRNYSNVYYGPVTLREALGNSLNIPAVRTIGYVGAGNYLTTLHRLGFESLDQSSEVYDEGLALGDGAVTLFELVQGYTALAHHGLYRSLQSALPHTTTASVRVYSDEATSVIANILSDPYARDLEFGVDSVLNLPGQTAAKTGTSTDYRDAWTVGFNDRYVVGLWMGNLDSAPMDNVTGSTGPALAMRSIFSLLDQNRDGRPLYQSPRLVAQDVCVDSAKKGLPCATHTELFVPGTAPVAGAGHPKRQTSITLIRPTDGLEMAYDPRVPAEAQKFKFELAGTQPGDRIDWILDGKNIAGGTDTEYLWQIARGKHDLSVRVNHGQQTMARLPPAEFMVK